MECSCNETDVPGSACGPGEAPAPAVLQELVAALLRIEKMISRARRVADMSDDQKWRLVCAGSLVGIAKSHVKTVSET